jgi:putative transposase
MRCPSCGPTAISERPERTAQGYRRFRCANCGKQFNERSTGVLDRVQYLSDVIALVVLWRLRYKLNLRDLAEMFLTRGFTFSYEAVRDWEAKLTPTLAEHLRRRRKGRIGPSWYIDETYIRVRGRWRYLYRAIDRDGALVDVMLSEHRNLAAARAFFRSAKAVTGVTPDRVTADGHDAYPSSIRTELGKHVRHRTSRYLNNRLEQDHRGIKDRCRPMLGLKSTVSAARYCRGYDELQNSHADPVCANMFPPQCGAGSIGGKPRLSSLSWQQLESWRRCSKLVELNGAKTDRAGGPPPIP